MVLLKVGETEANFRCLPQTRRSRGGRCVVGVPFFGMTERSTIINILQHCSMPLKAVADGESSKGAVQFL